MSFNTAWILVPLLCASAFATDCGSAGQCEEDEVSLVQVRSSLKRGVPNFATSVAGFEAMIGEPGLSVPAPAASADPLGIASTLDVPADAGYLGTGLAADVLGADGLDPFVGNAAAEVADEDAYTDPTSSQMLARETKYADDYNQDTKDAYTDPTSPQMKARETKYADDYDKDTADLYTDPTSPQMLARETKYADGGESQDWEALAEALSAVQVDSSAEQDEAGPPLGKDEGFGWKELKKIDGKKPLDFGAKDVKKFTLAHPFGLKQLGRGHDGLGTPQFGNKNLKTMPKEYGLKDIRKFIKQHPWGAKSLKPLKEWGTKETERVLAKTSIGLKELRKAGKEWGLKDFKKAAAQVKSSMLPDGTVPSIDGDLGQFALPSLGLDGSAPAADTFTAQYGLNAYPNTASYKLSLDNDATNYFGDNAMELKGYDVGMAGEVAESQAQAATNEHEFVNSLAVEARDDAASAKELLNGMAARTNAFAHTVADVAAVQGAELMADAHEQAAAEVFTTAVANRDRAEANRARDLELVNAVNVANAKARADAALEEGAEADGYADAVRQATAHRLVVQAESRNLVNNAAKAVNAQTVDFNTDLSQLNEMQNANTAYSNKELWSAATAGMADTREAAAESVAEETEELTTDVRAAAAQKVADQVAAANARKAEFADKEDMRKAVAAAGEEQRANDWKVEQEYDQYEASDVADAEKIAAARVQANARQVAQARAAYVAEARDIAGQVAGVNSQRKADVAAAAKAEAAENSALVAAAQQIPQAEAAQWSGDAAWAKQFETANAKDVMADVAAANAQRALDKQQAASVVKSELSSTDQAARALIAAGAQDVSAANEYASDESNAAQNFGSEAVDYAKENALSIAALAKAENADTVAAEGQIASLNSASWASDATAAEQSDLADVASDVGFAKTAYASDAADAAEVSDDVLAGTAAGSASVGGFYDTGYGAAFGAGLSGYGAGLGAAGYGSIAGGAASADALAGAMNDATGSATGLVDSMNYPSVAATGSATGLVDSMNFPSVAGLV